MIPLITQRNREKILNQLLYELKLYNKLFNATTDISQKEHWELMIKEVQEEIRLFNETQKKLEKEHKD